MEPINVPIDFEIALIAYSRVKQGLIDDFDRHPFVYQGIYLRNRFGLETQTTVGRGAVDIGWEISPVDAAGQ